MKTLVAKLAIFFVLGMSLMAQDNPANAVAAAGHPDGPPSEEAELTQCSTRNEVFQDGEEITYQIYYNWNFVWLSAGEVVFRVHDLGDQYHLSVVGKTYPSYEWFFKVEDKYDSYIDKQTLLPKVSIRDVHEGGYRLYDKVVFNRDQQIARSLRGKTSETAKWTEYPIEQCMHDVLSIIYFTRNLDFNAMEEGDRLPIKIFMDKETWPLEVEYKGKDRKKRVRGMGKFRTIQFSPEVIAGHIFNEGARMDVWVTDDKNRVPVLIESPVSVGSVKAVLKDYKGLKYEMTAAY